MTHQRGGLTTRADGPIRGGDGLAMAETTFLQIQGRDQSASRVLELPIGPVRIGRGSHCEVRLGDDPGLGDVQCLLRRRGANWHFQPVGPPGHVWIDGRPADHQRPLAVGSSLRVGDHWLTLRTATSPPDVPGSYHAPITVELHVEAEPAPVAPAEPSAAPVAQDRPRPTSSPADDEERLRRWQARLEQRERWLKTRQDERTWEARWKAAGDTIRGRSTPAPDAPSRPTPTPPTPPPLARSQAPGPTRREDRRAAASVSLFPKAPGRTGPQSGPPARPGPSPDHRHLAPASTRTGPAGAASPGRPASARPDTGRAQDGP